MEDVQSTGLRPSATLLELKVPTPLEGFVVPQNILVHAVESGRAIPAFAATAGMDLFLHIPGSTLRAKLAPADFDLR